jgi:hypothetical protein
MIKKVTVTTPKYDTDTLQSLKTLSATKVTNPPKIFTISRTFVPKLPSSQIFQPTPTTSESKPLNKTDTPLKQKIAPFEQQSTLLEVIIFQVLFTFLTVLEIKSGNNISFCYLCGFIAFCEW